MRSPGGIIADYIVEAVSIAKALGATGIPVKLQWTREDDIQGGRYRPIYVHRLEAALDNDGHLVGWRHRIVGQSIMAGTAFAAARIKNGIDRTSVEGAANLPYAVPNMAVELNTTETGVPVLWWRVVGSSHTSFATEAFIDEIAQAAAKDPFAFRQAMLEHHPRHKAVLELAAKAAGWGEPLPKGKGRGIAVAEAFGSYVAQVAEVTVAPNGDIKVDRVVCAVDCGTPINPDVITAQMEGGIGFGLGAALYGAITLKDGKVERLTSTAIRCCASTRCPGSRCTSCNRQKCRPASASPALLRSGRPSPTRSSPPPASGCVFYCSPRAALLKGLEPNSFGSDP